jgi:mRNA interferase MazF
MNGKPGDVFWISPSGSNGIASDHTHPHVFVRDETSNAVMVCALTSNLKRAKEPGNVLLEEGEANLPRRSVVVVSQVFTIDKLQLGEYIGTLSEPRIHQVLTGMQFVQYMVQHHLTHGE